MRPAILATVCALTAWSLAGPARAQSFSNAGSLSIPDHGANSSASAIAVSGLSGGVASLTVQLKGLNVPGTADLDFLLVGPGGQSLIIVSDAGGFNTISGVNITLSDAAASQLGLSTPFTTGTFRPTNYNDGADVFPSPAPAGPYASAAPTGAATLTSVFAGTAPNGTWTLYVYDDAAGGGVSTMSAGWTLNFTVLPPTTTVLTSSLNPCFTTSPGNAVSFMAAVTSAGGPVTTGTVTFRDGSTVVAGPTALDGAGHAVFSTSALSEGTHAMSATFNGTASLSTSVGVLTQVADNHTHVTLPSFCNDGAIALADGPVAPLVANPYPSHIFVSGFGGLITGLTVTLRGITEPISDDLDLMLLGPGGQKFVLMADAGGLNAASNLTITLSDAAASSLPDATLIPPGSLKPAAYAAGGVTFPSPAPAAPYGLAAPSGASTFGSLFTGASPNGTWSLYVIDDTSGGGAGTIASGWCLNFAAAMVGEDQPPLLPAETRLLAPRPAPMRAAVVLPFALARAARVQLEIFDAGGRRIRLLEDRLLEAGAHDATWDGRNAAGRDVGPGVYFARLRAAGTWSVQQVVRIE